MFELVAFSLLLLALAPVIYGIARGTELFCVRVTDGKVHHTRGRLPPALLSDMSDVVARPAVSRAVVRAVLQRGEPRLLVRGDVSEAQVQQLRNVFGRFRLAQIRAGRPPQR